MTQNGPITGHVDLATMTATVNTSFNFAITKATLSLFPWLNLVGRSCRGTAPINVTLSGPVSLTGTSTFDATYTLPKLTGCGLLTPVLNLIIPGPGQHLQRVVRSCGLSGRSAVLDAGLRPPSGGGGRRPASCAWCDQPSLPVAARGARRPGRAHAGRACGPG